MKKVISGTGADTTAAVLAYLQAGNEFFIAELYLIGNIGDPRAIMLTDWESPLVWSVIPGTFKNAVVKRSDVVNRIGFDKDTTNIDWLPKASTFPEDVNTANPMELARIGYYDGWPVYLWTAYMPTAGDANTYGCSELFAGKVGDVNCNRGNLSFSVDNLMKAMTQNVPTTVIELLNTGAAYAGATPPAGFVNIPQFDVITGSSVNVVVGDQTFPVAHSILDDNNCRGGYLFFNPGGTLDGVWASIQQNTRVTVSGTDYNQFVLYGDLPWPPTPGVDTFYVSARAPIDQSEGEYIGFPYVPNPEMAV